MNPFSSRFVEPGAVPFLFRHGEDVESLIGRFLANGERGQIVGPHGCGKSTLLHTLLPPLTERLGAGSPIFVALHDGERRLPRAFRADFQCNSSCEKPRLVVIDGYEQLGYVERLRLRWYCRRLLITTHRAVWGLPVLIRESPDADRFLRAVHFLCKNSVGGRGDLFSDAELVALFKKHRGDCRAALFDLYDLFESRNTPGSDR